MIYTGILSCMRKQSFKDYRFDSNTHVDFFTRDKGFQRYHVVCEQKRNLAIVEVSTFLKAFASVHLVT